MKISKIISTSTAALSAIILFANTASLPNATSIAQGASEVDYTTHWFGSGYTRYYDAVDYSVTTMVDGTINVAATVNRSYTPDELEGDYIKFGIIKYSDDNTRLQFDTAKFTNGEFFTVDKTPEGSPSELHCIEIWCKHAAWGLSEGAIFNFTLSPTSESVRAKVEIFDKSYQMVNSTGGGYAGINHYMNYSFDEWFTSTHATVNIADPPGPIVDDFDEIDIGHLDTLPATTTVQTTTAVTTTTTTVVPAVDVNEPCYDVNGDGEINWDDVTVLVQYIVVNSES